MRTITITEAEAKVLWKLGVELRQEAPVIHLTASSKSHLFRLIDKATTASKKITS